EVDLEETSGLLGERVLRLLLREDERLDVLGVPVGFEDFEDGRDARRCPVHALPVEPFHRGMNRRAEGDRGRTPGTRDLVDVLETVLEATAKIRLDLAKADDGQLHCHLPLKRGRWSGAARRSSSQPQPW